MTLSRSQIVQVILLLVICSGVAYGKLSVLHFSPSNDYFEYVATAKALAHEGGYINQARILKPLDPFVVSITGRVIGYEYAQLYQALFFYLALVVCMYVFAHEFFADHKLALISAAFVGLSYPILRYGVEPYSETGALVFFVTSLWLTLRFSKDPSFMTFILNVVVVTIGFLWKEYAIVGGIILAIVTLLHPLLSLKEKIRMSAAAVALFLAIHIPWQLYVNAMYGFNYLKWSATSTAGFSSEFTLKNVTKSIAALLGLAWLLVPIGAMRLRSFESSLRRFMYVALPVPFMGLLWGYISSRTLYVIAPSMVVLAVAAMKGWAPWSRIAFIVVTIAANITWLYLSYSIKL